MKKIFIAIMLLFATNIGFVQADEPVILHPTGKHNKGKGNKPKSPIVIPEAYIDGYTLSFDESCIGCHVTLFDEDENIVFTAIVDENGIVTLPDSLSGTFELQLERGSIMFVGEIVL